jgi:hypothetical protein
MIIVFGIGAVLALVGGLGVLLAAFRTGMLWGLAILLLSPLSLIYLVLYWQEAKRPFFLEMIGIVIMYASSSYIS